MERFNDNVRLKLTANNFETYIKWFCGEVKQLNRWRHIKWYINRDQAGGVEYTIKHEPVEKLPQHDRYRASENRGDIDASVKIYFDKYGQCSLHIEYDPIYGDSLRNFYHITEEAPAGYLGKIGRIDSMYMIDAVLKREFLYDINRP